MLIFLRVVATFYFESRGIFGKAASVINWAGIRRMDTEGGEEGSSLWLSLFEKHNTCLNVVSDNVFDEKLFNITDSVHSAPLRFVVQCEN